MKKMILFVLLSVGVLGNSGCFFLVAGAAAGGTAFWLSEKLTQTFNVPYDRVVTATEKALNSLDMPINKQLKTGDVTQFRSKYTNGLETWVDVRRVTATSTTVEVRVGAINPDKEASHKVLKAIQRHL
jgi:hypothetical protein